MRAIIWSLVITAVAVMPAAAQGGFRDDDERRPAVVVIGGASQYDLSGTGTRRFVGARGQFPVLRHFVIEPGVTYMNYRVQGTQPAPRAAMWFPEVQVQAELPLGSVLPYLGVGGGVAVASLADERETEPTLSVAGGVRVPLPGGWGLGGELRVRAVDPWVGTTADWGLSLSRRL